VEETIQVAEALELLFLEEGHQAVMEDLMEEEGEAQRDF
jgi:hypothetical protein